MRSQSRQTRRHAPPGLPNDLYIVTEKVFGVNFNFIDNNSERSMDSFLYTVIQFLCYFSNPPIPKENNIRFDLPEE